jgi:DNA-binding transcriptional LysR family regulator
VNLKDYDLNKLYVFACVARAKSMTSAAKELGRTPSAISQSITQLERSMGMTLFRRVGTTLHLTGEGVTLLHAFKQAQNCLEVGLEQILEPRGELKGAIRIGLFPGFKVSVFSENVAELLRDNHHAHIRLRFLSHSELASQLLEDKVDFAFSLFPLSRVSKNLVSEEAFREELVLVSKRQKETKRLSREDLKKIPVIEYFQSVSLFREWCQNCFGREIKQVFVRAYAENLESVLELVDAGVGYAVIPRSCVTTNLRIHEIGSRKFYKHTFLNFVRSGPPSRQANELLRRFRRDQILNARSRTELAR